MGGYKQMKKIDADEVPNWLSSFWNKTHYKNIIAGINDDDCAIIQIAEDTKLVITTDFLNANPISVELGISNAFNIGRLIVASNLSDLCGTGALPIAFLLGITMTHDDEFDYLKKLLEGVKYELDKLSIPLIGGDTKLGKSKAFIGTAIGLANLDRKLYLKNTAKPNDIIWVSGKIGNVSASVYGLSKNNMNKEWNENAKRYINNPSIPILQSEFVAKSKYGNGGTDISDGLGADLFDLLNSSNVGANIYANKIPCSDLTIELANKINIESWFFSLIIGGDFQFIVTTDRKFRKEMIENDFYEIGEITFVKEKNLIIDDNTKVIFPTLGHRDSRKLTFAEEVDSILNHLKEKIYGTN